MNRILACIGNFGFHPSLCRALKLEGEWGPSVDGPMADVDSLRTEIQLFY